MRHRIYRSTENALPTLRSPKKSFVSYCNRANKNTFQLNSSFEEQWRSQMNNNAQWRAHKNNRLATVLSILLLQGTPIANKTISSTYNIESVCLMLVPVLRSAKQFANRIEHLTQKILELEAHSFTMALTCTVDRRETRAINWKDRAIRRPRQGHSFAAMVLFICWLHRESDWHVSKALPWL